MALTSEEQAIAAAIVSEWDWQIAEGHKYKFSQALSTVVRYYECAPMESDQFRLVIEYLRAQTGMTDITLNQKKITLEGTWSAEDAWYQTAQGDKYEGTEQNRVRIYQALVGKENGDAADGPYTVEDGCRYQVEHTFYWDVAELPVLPSSASGVHYTLQGVTRDKKNGKFSCVIEKRTRVQQDIEYYESSKLTHQTVERAAHLGVKADDVASTGDAASVSNGVRIERVLRKNEDCTTDVENEKTTSIAESDTVKEYQQRLRGLLTTTTDRNQNTQVDSTGMKPGENRRSEKNGVQQFNNTTTVPSGAAEGVISSTCVKTQFVHTHEETTNTATAPASGEATEAGSGVVYRKQVVKTEFDNYDVSERTDTEQNVKNAVKVFRRTHRGLVTSSQDRSEAAALTADGMTPGEERRTEKTDGKLHNNTTTTVTPIEGGELESSCADAGSVVHSDTTLTNVNTKPTGHLSAQANVEQRRRIVKTSENNYDVVEETTTYTPTSTGNMTFGTSSTSTVLKIGENQTAAPSPGVGTQNTETRVTARPNGHGSFSTTEETTTFTPRSATISGGSSLAAITVTASRDATTQTAAETPADNKDVDVTIEPNGHGSYNKTERVTVYTPKSKLKTWSDDYFNYIRLTYVNMSAPVTAAPAQVLTDTSSATATVPAEGARISCSFSPNGHGSFNGEVMVSTRKADDGQTLKTLFWEKTENGQTAYYLYHDKNGNPQTITFTYDQYSCYGPIRTVMDKVSGGQSCAHIGLKSGVKAFYPPDMGYGLKYSNIQWTDSGTSNPS